MKPAPSLPQLLELLRRENERDNGRGALAQELAKPEPPARSIATLDGKPRPVTPQLAARFAFAGAWDNAILGQTWLAPSQMARVMKRRAWRSEVELRREHWTRSPVARLPLERLSLFAVDADDGGATYLVWPESRSSHDEPALRIFSGASETGYPDLATLVRKYLGPSVLRLAGRDTATPTGDLARYLADDKTRLDVWVGGLERFGQPVVARAAIAVAELALRELPVDKRKACAHILDRARAWAERPRGELPSETRRAINNTRPIAPEIEGKRTWILMHACCEAAQAACSYHVERVPVVDSDGVRDALVGLRKRKAVEVARALNDAGLTTATGARWATATAAKAQRRLEYTLEAARDSASATVEHLVEGLGKKIEKPAREAVRAALAPGGGKDRRRAR